MELVVIQPAFITLPLIYRSVNSLLSLVLSYFKIMILQIKRSAVVHFAEDIIQKISLFSPIPLLFVLIFFKKIYLLAEKYFGPHKSLDDAKHYLRAGPRKHLFFDPQEVVAGIVTSYAISPGINVILREIVNELYLNYSISVQQF